MKRYIIPWKVVKYMRRYIDSWRGMKKEYKNEDMKRSIVYLGGSNIIFWWIFYLWHEPCVHSNRPMSVRRLEPEWGLDSSLHVGSCIQAGSYKRVGSFNLAGSRSLMLCNVKSYLIKIYLSYSYMCCSSYVFVYFIYIYIHTIGKCHDWFIIHMTD